MLDKVIFPADHDPRVSSLYALNEIDARAPIETVWKLLVEAGSWFEHFPAENRISILGGARELGPGTRFTRVTVGFAMSCRVTEHVPMRRLAWSTTVEGDETGSTAYHGWVLTPTATGTHILTEETLQGPFYLEEIGRKAPGALYDYHQTWVEGLAKRAEALAGYSGA
ncbi:SRPBCC family protein [Oceanicella sp. SM1341]|uniref:SRPBCC family protein n=1 Tax=Oceanicella sp. SM1341 TaxID=1548889 RepID=UPI000E49B426|nr:SRPBCC family protein [Oceanicella sp. SM1341]